MTADHNDSGDSSRGTPTIAEISEIQAAYILENHPDAVVYPPRQPGEKNPASIEFIHRNLYLLTRDTDLPGVLGVLQDSPAEGITHPIPGLSLVPLKGPDDPVGQSRVLFGALEEVRQQLGPGIAAPDHLISITGPLPPATDCPATEPDWVPPNAAPQPGISRSCCDGRGTRVAVVDTGLVEVAPASHSWMYGVVGDRDLQVREGISIERYGGHGTFIASEIRAMAPRAEVRVVRAFEKAGAIFESDIVKMLISVLDWAPDVISLSAGTHTWQNYGLMSFEVFVNGPLREARNTVLVAAAGNDGADWRFSPADMDPVIGVGALGPPGDALAWFSDFGDWVKVYAPGQDLVHAFGRGLYRYYEARRGEQAEFAGMARWSGTSFSTPLVAGLIAARMSGTGERAREAADSLLRLARAQALPGVGPVLRPGQACLCPDEHR